MGGGTARPGATHAKESQRSWDSIQGLNNDQCEDTSCTAPYKMYMNGGGKTVGDVTTTCLSLVASGCYQTKSPCCSALSAKWEQLEIATGTCIWASYLAAFCLPSLCFLLDRVSNFQQKSVTVCAV